ncbi:hypothetical protein [Candidatus Methylobacter favarea]|nr:hypothetical protein [Candidatus Methylobacter favarea]
MRVSKTAWITGIFDQFIQRPGFNNSRTPSRSCILAVVTLTVNSSLPRIN